MKSLSRVLKSSFVTIDSDNKVSIEVSDPSSFMLVAGSESDISEDEIETVPVDDEIESAKAEADAIIKDANNQAKTIIDQAHKEAETLLAQAVEKGHTEGHDAGYQKGYQESEVLKNEAAAIHVQAIKQRETTIQSIEPDMLELIVKILNKLLTDTTHINPQIIMNLIKQGLDGATLSGEVTIRVSPADYDYVTDNKDQVFSFIDTSSKIEFIKDVALKKSDCIIETPFGNIDSSLDRQFGAIKNDLYYIYEENR